MSKSIDVIVNLKDKLTPELPKVSTGIMKLSSNTKAMGRRMKRSGAYIEGVGSSILKTTAPLGALGAMALKTGAEFDSSMSRVKAITNATGTAFNQLREKAIQIGGSTSKSATDAANAMTYLAQSGMKYNDILKTSESLVKLSVVGNMDMAETANKWVSATKSANIPLAENNKFLNMLSKTANDSNANIGELLDTWTSAGASIKSSNMSMSETNALFGIMANNGLKASEAGTSLSRIFQRLDSGAGEVGQVLKRLNVNIADNQGHLRNKAEVLKELKEKTDKLTEAERSKLMIQLAGKQYAGDLKNLLDGLGPSYDKLKGSIENSNGTMDKMSDIMKNNLKGDLTTLKSSLETTLIKISDAITPTARDFIKHITGMVQAIGKMDKKTIRTIAKVALAVAQFGLVTMAIGKTKKAIGGSLEVWGSLGQYIFGTNEKMSNLRNTMKTVKLVGGKLGKVISFPFKDGLKAVNLFKKANIFSHIVKGSKLAALALKGGLMKGLSSVLNLGRGLMALLAGIGPIGWIVIGVAVALAGAGILIYKNWDKIKTMFSNLKKSFSDFAKSSIKSISKFYSAFSNSKLGKVFKPFLEGIKGTFGGIKKVFTGILTFLSGFFTGNWSKAWDGIKMVFRGFKDFIFNYWKMIGGLLSAPIRAVVLCLKDKFKGSIDFVKKKWKETKQLLSRKITGIVHCLADKFHSAIDGIKKAWENLKNFLAHPIRGIVNMVQGDSDGSHLGGLSRVPFDGYRATLHRDEMVLTKQQAEQYRHGRNSGQVINKNTYLNKLADKIIVKDREHIDILAEEFARRLQVVG